MFTCRILWVGALLVLGLPAAAANFTAAADGCASQIVMTVDAPASATSARSACTDPFGYGGSAARANSLGLGASAEWFTECCGSATGGSAQASAQTQFIIIGPPGLVDIELNLRLKGTVTGGTVTGFSHRRIELSATIAGIWRTGFIDEVADANGLTLTTGGTLVMPPGTCPSPCNLVTPTITVAANTQIPLGLTLYAIVGGYGHGYGRASAYDSLTFPIGEDVFNLPDGYTAVIYGMNVENNRVVGQEEPPIGVPEPATLLPAGAALAAVALGRNRSRRLGG